MLETTGLKDETQNRKDSTVVHGPIASIPAPITQAAINKVSHSYSRGPKFAEYQIHIRLIEFFLTTPILRRFHNDAESLVASFSSYRVYFEI